jgi:hypothetical protein
MGIDPHRECQTNNWMALPIMSTTRLKLITAEAFERIPDQKDRSFQPLSMIFEIFA